MDLFTDAELSILCFNDQFDNCSPVAKLYIPGTACVWLLCSIDPENPEIAFGLCDLGLGFPELGYVSLDEIVSLEDYTLCRDENFKGLLPISIYAQVARNANPARIIDDPEEISKILESMQ